MSSAHAIKVPFYRRSVTFGFWALALLAAWTCPLGSAAGSGSAPPASEPTPEIVQGTNVYAQGNLTVHCLSVGKLSANCYLVADSNRNAVVIDPGASPVGIHTYLADRRLHVLAYVLTHSHLDHISALDELVDLCPAAVAMHPEENDWAFCEKNEWLPWYPRTKPVTVARPLGHLQRFDEGGLHYTVIHTPGHSPGSVCIWFPQEKIVFTGDTLFAGTVGRTDLHRSSTTSLMRSLGVFWMLPPETVLYPGHGKPTTVKAELETNPFMQDVPNPTADPPGARATSGPDRAARGK